MGRACEMCRASHLPPRLSGDRVFAAFMTTYFCVYFGSLVLALLSTPAVIWLARRIGAVDWPGIRTVHKLPIPRIGGVAIFLSAMTLIIR